MLDIRHILCMVKICFPEFWKLP